MTDKEENIEDAEKSRESEFSTELIDDAARKIIQIERQCFYGDEPERDRLRKIREELLNLTA